MALSKFQCYFRRTFEDQHNMCQQDAEMLDKMNTGMLRYFIEDFSVFSTNNHDQLWESRRLVVTCMSPNAVATELATAGDEWMINNAIYIMIIDIPKLH